jgi:hypothetical protein
MSEEVEVSSEVPHDIDVNGEEDPDPVSEHLAEEEVDEEDRPEEYIEIETYDGVYEIEASKLEEQPQEFIVKIQTADGLRHVGVSIIVQSAVLMPIVKEMQHKIEEREKKNKPPVGEAPIEAPGINLETLRSIFEMMRDRTIWNSPELAKIFLDAIPKEKLMDMLTGCNYLEIQEGKELILNYLGSEIERLAENDLYAFFELDKDWASEVEEGTVRVYNGLTERVSEESVSVV